MLTVFKVDSGQMSIIYDGCRFLKSPDYRFLSPIDARIINIENLNTSIPSAEIHNLYIVGSRSGQGELNLLGQPNIMNPVISSVKTTDITIPLKDTRVVINPEYLGQDKENDLMFDYNPYGNHHYCEWFCHPGWKQSVSRMQLWIDKESSLIGTSFSNEDSSEQWYNNTSCKQNSLLNVASWYPNLEKNFVGYYFSDDNTTDLDIDTSYEKVLYRIFPDSQFRNVSGSIIS